MLIFVHLLDDFSGSPRVLRDLISSLEDLDPDRQLIFGGSDGFLSDLSIRTRRHLYKKSRSRLWQASLYILAQVDLFFKVQSAVRQNTIHGRRSLVVVNAVLPIGAVLGAFVARTKTVLIMHETTFRPRFLRNIYRFVINQCADDVVYVSHYLKSVEFFDRPKLHVLPNGLRSDFSCEPSLNVKAKFEGRTILFVGSLKEYKGLRQFCELTKLLPDFRFLAVLNCEVEQARQYFYENRLEANATYVVRPSDLAELYSSAMLVMNLSIPELWIETFGLTILEGMHFGCPVIVPKVGGHCDFVSCRHGLLEDSVNTSTIADFIRELANDFGRYKTYSDACTEDAANYSHAKTSVNNKKFFNSLMLSV